LPRPLYAVLERLFDDASLFPPASKPMAEAMRAHAEAVAGPHRRVAGPFLCPSLRLPELDALVTSGLPAPDAVGVVGYDGFGDWRKAFATPGLVHVEIPAGAPVPDSPGRVQRYVELAPQADVGPALDAIAKSGSRVKVRCDGPTRYAVPSCEWLASVLVACASRHLMLKAAGGPHRPFRETGPGGARHGFVNLLAAAGAARRGAPESMIAEVLALEAPDAAGLVDHVAGAREVVASISACSITGPVLALEEHDLL